MQFALHSTIKFLFEECFNLRFELRTASGNRENATIRGRNDFCTINRIYGKLSPGRYGSFHEQTRNDQTSYRHTAPETDNGYQDLVLLSVRVPIEAEEYSVSLRHAKGRNLKRKRFD